MKLHDRVALITGGSSGIGLATARLFLEEGAMVIISGRDPHRGQRALSELQGPDRNVIFIQADISKVEDAKTLVAQGFAQWGRIDILFNNAGIILKPSTVENILESDWDRIIDTNLKGVFLVSKYTVPHMLRQGRGVIVNNSSCAGIIGSCGDPAYSASKGGVSLLTKSMALDYARKNIRVNAICCGGIDTPMLQQEARESGRPLAEYMKDEAAEHPLGRVGTPEEAARAVLFLVSDDSSFVTGTLLSVDGGLTAG
jgi:NAD(P)-dependent dehydrogenase (short-subunit alcohol dehydrogenase family)